MKKITLIISIICITLALTAQDMQWTKVETLIGDAYANVFGTSVSIDGDYMVVGDPSDNEDATDGGTVYIYKKNASNPKEWDLLKKITNSNANYEFGYDCQIIGDRLFVATYFNGVYIYEKNEGGTDNWGYITLITEAGLPRDFLGIDFSANGDRVAIRNFDYDTYTEDCNVCIFEKDEGGTDNWGLVKTIYCSNSEYDTFGTSISLNGDFVLIGNPAGMNTSGDDVGFAYLHKKDEGGTDNWGIVKTFEGDNDRDQLGSFVIMGKLNLFISMPIYNEDEEVHIHTKNWGGFNNWGLKKTIIGNSGHFVKVMALENPLLIIADKFIDGTYDHEGKMYIHGRNYETINNWGERQAISPENPSEDAYFGSDVAVSGDTIVVAIRGQNKVVIFYPEEPVMQASNVEITDATQTSLTFNWTDGDGDSRAIFMKATTTGSPEPENYTSYTANLSFESGSQIGTTGWYCVYNGDGSHSSGITVNNLTASTDYKIMVCEYNFGTNEQIYLTETDTDNPINARTKENIASVEIHILNQQLLNTTVGMEYEMNQNNNWISCTDGTTENVEYEPMGGDFQGEIRIRDKIYNTNYNIIYFEEPVPPIVTINYEDAETNEEIGIDMEYSYTEDFATAYDGENQVVFININNDENIYFRYKATQDDLASEILDLVIPDRPETPSYSIDYETIKTTENIPTTVEYAENINFTTNLQNGEGVAIDLEPGVNLWFRVASSNTNQNFISESFAMTVPTQPDAPTNPVVDDANNTFGWTNVSGYSDADMYEYSINNGAGWEECTANPQPIGNITIPTGEAQIRVHASAASEYFYGESMLSDVDFNGVTLLDLLNVGYHVANGELTNTTTDMEYQLGSVFSDWYACADGTTDVTFIIGNVRVRQASYTQNYRAITLLYSIDEPEITIDYTNEQTNQEITSDIEYNYDNDFETANILGDGTVLALTPGEDVYFRYLVTETTLASEINSLDVRERPDAPTLPVVDDDENTFDWTNISETEYYDYEYSIDNGNSWTTCTEKPINIENIDVPTGEVQVRTLPVISKPTTTLYFAGESLLSDAPFTSLTIIELGSIGYHVANGELTNTTIELEYQIGETKTWTICDDGTTTGIEFIAGNIEVRQIDYTENYRLITTLVVPDAPAITIDFINETTNENITSAIEYNYDNDFATANNTGAGTSLDLIPDEDVYFRYLPTETDLTSYVAILDVANRPATPAEPIVDDENNTFAWTFSTGFEDINDYEFSINAGNDWTNCTENPLNIGDIALSIGDVRVRILATETYFKSESLLSDAPFTGITVIELSDIGYHVANGELTGTTTELEYQIGETKTWTVCDDGTTTGIEFITGNIEVRQIDYTANYRLIATLTIPEAPIITIDFINEVTNENITSAIEYNYDNDFATANSTGSGSSLDLIPNEDVYFRYLPTETDLTSYVAILDVVSRPATPTDGVVDDINNTFAWTYTTGYEDINNYEFSTDAGNDWATCTENPLSIGNISLSIGDVMVRILATETYFKSESLLSDAPYTIGTNIVDLQNNIITYPNPTNGILHIDFTNLEKFENISIQITDIIGKTIFEQTELEQNETIDLANFENGVYIIKIQTAKKIFITRIIKE